MFRALLLAASGLAGLSMGTKELGTKRQLKVRDFTLTVKADGVADDGTFEGYGSVFGVVDSYQEVVAPGAFTDSLAELAAKSRVVPVLWQHRQDQPIGVYSEITEDDTGPVRQGPAADWRGRPGERGACADEGRRGHRPFDRLLGARVQL
jgi:hypothetical protein